MTTDESRAADWYHSVIMIEPEPKPVQTDATIHSLCVTCGPLRTNKHFVRVYRGKIDEDLDTKHQNTAILQKWVNLYDIMLDNYEGKGHCVMVDSASMGDLMALIGCHEWKISMVGTSQENRTKADIEEEKEGMKKKMNDAVIWQHTNEHLLYAIWSDNNLGHTLSNFHTQEVGIKRKRKANKRREREPAAVPCPQQNINYSNTFHQIDKGNGVEAKYDLAS